MSLRWEKIKHVLIEHPAAFGDPKCPSNIVPDRIKRAILEKKPENEGGWFGLYYSFGYEHALLGIEASRGEGFIAGVRCHEEKHEQEYREIHGKLKDYGGESREWWPWFRIVRDNGTGLNPGDLGDLKALLREIDWNALAKDCLQTLEDVRERLDLKR